MNKAAIYHVSFSNFAFPVSDNSLKLRIKAARGDLKKVKVIYGPRFNINNREPNYCQKMKLSGSDLEHDYFTATIFLDDPRFRYHFLLNDGQKTLWYNERGFFENRPRGYDSGFFQYSLITKDDIIDKPNWLNNAVVYQIFPERFYNGNKSLNPENCQKWGEKPDRNSFFGGDLQGILEKVDYLKNLGVNVIYLTPIFKSPTNHKYNIDDYYQIDPHFGDKDTAKKLVEEAHNREIKVIFDAVFNHSGYNFFAFRDLREKGENSKYKDWYKYQSLPLKTEPPLNYETFARDIPTLPKLNTANPEVQDYLLNVTKYWMEYLNIDGWRLDVADEVAPSFWVRFRKLVKKINPEAYILGEVWHNGQKWLQGQHFDGIMNYSFTQALIDFFAKKNIGPVEFDARLTKNRMKYKEQVSKSLLNLLDSHDTARFLNHSRQQIDALKLAVLLQMTYTGIPLIYYGDEVGLSGGEDPDNRRCMPWKKSKQNRELFDFYQKLIKIRKKYPTLQKGNFESFLIDESRNIYGYKRYFKQKIIYVIINNSSVKHKIRLDKKIPAGKKYNDILNEKKYKYQKEKQNFTITIKAHSGVILI